MEFKSLRNIENSFRRVRLYTIVFALLCMGVTISSLVSAYNFANKQREKIYVLDQGKSLILALSQDVEANRPVEAREHLSRFHELFFTLAPESQAIQSNISRALDMADESAYNYYTDLQEEKYYNRLISTNTSQVLTVDSISCDFNVYPYEAVVYGTQTIYRKSNVTERSLVTACSLLNTVRSDRNPQGFLITKFRVINNETRRTIPR